MTYYLKYTAAVIAAGVSLYLICFAAWQFATVKYDTCRAAGHSKVTCIFYAGM